MACSPDSTPPWRQKKRAQSARAFLATLPLWLYLAGQDTVAAPAFVADPATFITTEFLASRALLPINAQYAYARGYTGKGVLVAVVDSGLDINHPEFQNRVLAQWARNYFVYGGPTDVSDIKDNGDIDGHGSHVAGLIGAGRNGFGTHGVAYNATLLPLRAIGNATDSATIDAFDQAIRAGAKVLNGSYGPPTLERYLPSAGGWVANPNYQQLAKQIIMGSDLTGEVASLKRAADADVVMVFSTGNQFTDQPVAALSPAGNALLPYITPATIAAGKFQFLDGDDDFDIQNPATWELVSDTDPLVKDFDFSALKGTLIAVASVDREGVIASYSNRCGVAASWCIVAPGGDFYSTANFDSSVSQLWSTYPFSTYKDMAGTSMASPVVAGAAAVLREAFPYMSARQIIEVMLTTTNATGIYADQSIYGRGLLDLRTAINGPIEFGAWDFPATFDVDTQGYDSHWNNDIRGSGNLVKRGAGQLTLWGQNTYTGTTRIMGGKLVVNGSNDRSSLLTIEQGAIIGGSGTVGTTVVAGRVEPGNSIGTLTINGNYTQTASSTLAIEIDKQGRSDKVVVNGIADIQNATLELEGLDANAIGRDFNFLTATTITANSAFDTSALNRAFIDTDAVFSGSTFNLQIRRNRLTFADTGRSGNQRAAAHAIEGQGLGGAAYDNFVMLQNPADGADALGQLSGEIYASVQSALLNNSSLFYRAGTERLWHRNASIAAPDTAFSDAYASHPGNPARTPNESWVQVLGRWGHFGETGDAAKAYHSMGGLLFGADRRFGDHVYGGLAAGFTNESVRATGNSRTHIDGYHLMAYAGWSGALNARLGVSQSWYDMTTLRQISFANFGQAEADTLATSTQVFAETGLPIPINSSAVQLEPYTGVQHVWLRREAFQESGSTAALSGAGQSNKVTFSNLGVRMLFDLQTRPDQTLTGSVNLAWRHAWGNITPHSRQQFATGPQFNVTGATIGRNALIAEAGLALTMGDSSMLSLGYTGQLGSGSQNHGVQARAQWRF